MLVKGPPAANVEVKFNNATVWFAISWQTLSKCTVLFSEATPGGGGGGGWKAQGHQGCDLPAGSCGSCVSELNNGGDGRI